MPLPMVHLSVAYEIATKVGVVADTEPTFGAFLLGSLAPDSIHMREGWTRDDKRRIHLFDESKSLTARFRAIDGLSSEAASGRAPKVSAAVRWFRDPEPAKAVFSDERRAFLAGYCSHLAADALWSHLLVRSYHASHVHDGVPFEVSRKRYYRETDKADFRIFYTAPWRADAWQLLQSTRALDFLDYLTADEIGSWRDRTVAFFQEPGKEPVVEPVFFTPRRIERFVRVASDACVAGLQATFVTSGRRLDEEYAVGALAD